MTEAHAGQDYLDACFGIQEQRRLAYIEEAQRDPKSVWFEGPASREGSAGASRKPVKRQGGSRGPERVLSVTKECSCCGRVFAGRRRSARYCGELCRQRSRRGRCEKAA
jgi:hypothetical protein